MIKKNTATAKQILEVVFLILDSNKNGMIDDVDVNAKINEKQGTVLVKVMKKWDAIAVKMNLTTPNFLISEDGEGLPTEENDSDRSAEPEYQTTVIKSVGAKDEL